MLWSIDSCQNRVCTDQYHLIVSRAHVWPIEVKYFLKLSAGKLLVFKRSQAQVHFLKKCIGNTLCLWAALLQCNMLSLVLENWARSILIVDTTCKLSNQHSTWKTKNQLCNFSLHFGGLFLFHCNYDIKEIHISSKFYSELLQWWSEFRSVFDSRRECQYILWNNKETRFHNKPVFYKKKKKKLFEQDFIFVNDLLLELETTSSFTITSNKISNLTT